MDDPDRGIHELWPEPWEGLPEEEEAWTWNEEDRQKDGRTSAPPHDRGKWYRWYFVYHRPSCDRVKISADQDPETGRWFNPHRSSGAIEFRMSRPAHDSVVDQSNLGDRIKEFYESLNDRQWVKCFEFIDPKLRDAGEIKFAAFASSLASFFVKYGPLTFQSVEQLRVYTDALSKRDEREFAYGLVSVKDRDHHPMQFRERWVKDTDGFWYTRKVGLV